MEIASLTPCPPLSGGGALGGSARNIFVSDKDGAVLP